MRSSVAINLSLALLLLSPSHVFALGPYSPRDLLSHPQYRIVLKGLEDAIRNGTAEKEIEDWEGRERVREERKVQKRLRREEEEKKRRKWEEEESSRKKRLEEEGRAGGSSDDSDSDGAQVVFGADEGERGDITTTDLVEPSRLPHVNSGTASVDSDINDDLEEEDITDFESSLHLLRTVSGQSFLCSVPSIPPPAPFKSHKNADPNNINTELKDGKGKDEEEEEVESEETKRREVGERRKVVEDEEEKGLERGLELLEGMRGSCLFLRHQWFTYSFCYGNQIRQFHALPSPTAPHLPIEDPQNDVYVLGHYPSGGPHQKPGPAPPLNLDGPHPNDNTKGLVGNDNHNRQDDDNSEVDLKPGRPVKGSVALSRGGLGAGGAQQLDRVNGPASLFGLGDLEGARTGGNFLIQRWEGGTECDVTRQRRKVEVQFHCSTTSTDRIALVRETAICEYVILIHTPRLCSDPLFSNGIIPGSDFAAGGHAGGSGIHGSGVEEVVCRPVVDDEWRGLGIGDGKDKTSQEGIDYPFADNVGSEEESFGGAAGNTNFQEGSNQDGESGNSDGGGNLGQDNQLGGSGSLGNPEEESILVFYDPQTGEMVVGDSNGESINSDKLIFGNSNDGNGADGGNGNGDGNNNGEEERETIERLEGLAKLMAQTLEAALGSGGDQGQQQANNGQRVENQQPRRQNDYIPNHQGGHDYGRQGRNQPDADGNFRVETGAAGYDAIMKLFQQVQRPTNGGGGGQRTAVDQQTQQGHGQQRQQQQGGGGGRGGGLQGILRNLQSHPGIAKHVPPSLRKQTSNQGGTGSGGNRLATDKHRELSERYKMTAKGGRKGKAAADMKQSEEEEQKKR